MTEKIVFEVYPDGSKHWVKYQQEDDWISMQPMVWNSPKDYLEFLIKEVPIYEPYWQRMLSELEKREPCNDD